MDYLPISLIGCISKILAEVPATGDRTAIGVFNFQVFFFFVFLYKPSCIGNKSYGVLIANVLLNSRYKEKRPGLICKLDME